MKGTDASFDLADRADLLDESFLKAHTELLEMVVQSRPLEEIFNRIALLIETLSPVHSWCTLAVRKGTPPALKLVAAPSTPPDFIEALRTLHSTQTDGTCGKAIASHSSVFVENVLEDPEFERFHELALKSGIMASWTVPVISSQGEVVAVITSFFHGTYRPGNAEIHKVEDLRNFISIALEKYEASDKLTDKESLFRSVASATNDAIWDLNMSENTLWWSEGFSRLFGFEGQGSGPTLDQWQSRVHLGDIETVIGSMDSAIREGRSHWSCEYRFLKMNGSTAYVLDQAEIIYDANGNARRMIGGMKDLTEQRLTQQNLTSVNRAFQLLSSCNKIVIRATGEKKLLTDICEIIHEMGGYELAWVGLTSGSSEKWISPAAFAGLETGYLSSIRLSYDEKHPTGNGPAGKTMRSGEHFICTDIKNETEDFFWKEEALKRGFNSVFCFPLKTDGNCFGILSLLSYETKSISEGELRLIRELADNLAFGVLSLRNRAKQTKTHEAIATVANTVSPGTGQEFYDLLTRNMVTALGAKGGIIGRISHGKRSISTLSNFMDNEKGENMVYELTDTPCENITNGDVCIFEHSVPKLFPEDHYLINAGIEAYAGIGLLDTDQNPIGILSVLFDQPIQDASLVRSLLRIFATRAASELMREETDMQIAAQASLLDKARDAIFTCDLDYNITFWNKSAERLYGWTGDEVIGRSVRGIIYQNSADHDKSIYAALESGQWNGDMFQKDKSGRLIIAESRWTLVRDAKGKPSSMLVINTDFTEHRKLEKQFLRAQRLESIGTLAGGIAHDLNNVLAPISMSIELLRGSIADERGRELLETIELCSNRGAEMINRMLSSFRSGEGRRITISVVSTLNELSNLLRETFPKNIRIETNYSESLTPVVGDSTQLHQVLMNLCVNARDAMPQGGLLRVSAENVFIDEKYAEANLNAKSGEYCCISVQDTGHGISKKIAGKIFDPFFTTKDIGKGTGLGLSISSAIMKDHGGLIERTEDQGKGSTFRIYLPATSVSPPPATLPGSSYTLPRGSGQTILIIDDEKAILDMTGKTLNEFGYKSIVADSGTSALEIYREKFRKIDVIITDIMMPDLDGFATAESILAINPDAKIIAVSGIDSNREITSDRYGAVCSFIRKPFTPQTILNSINEILTEE